MVSLSLKGKVALITGGSRGIGAETVRLFRQAGAKVVFNYQQARESALALVEECGGAGECVAIEQELSNVDGGQSLVEAAAVASGDWMRWLSITASGLLKMNRLRPCPVSAGSARWG